MTLIVRLSSSVVKTYDNVKVHWMGVSGKNWGTCRTKGDRMKRKWRKQSCVTGTCILLDTAEFLSHTHQWKNRQKTKQKLLMEVTQVGAIAQVRGIMQWKRLWNAQIYIWPRKIRWLLISLKALLLYKRRFVRWFFGRISPVGVQLFVFVVWRGPNKKAGGLSYTFP